jgi:hypothetical protein
MHRLNERACVNGRAYRSATRKTAALCSLCIAVLTPVRAAAQDISDDWRFSVTLYAWLPDIGGDTTFPTASGGDIDIDADTILDHLEMAAQGSFSLQKGHWGAYTDLIYLDIGASESQTRNITIGGTSLPATVTAATDLDLESIIWTVGISYRITASPAVTLDVSGGARLVSFEPNLEWEFTGDFGPIVPPPRTGSSEVSTDQWDGIVGVKGQLAFGGDRKWVVPYYLDVGTGDSDLTWQALLGLGYAFGWGELRVVWRYLDYDLKSGRAIADLNFNGPAFGAALRW